MFLRCVSLCCLVLTVGCDERDPAALALRLDELQLKGTHNSYHIDPKLDVPEWAYTHAPLSVQLARQNVRQFEIDVYFDVLTRSFAVRHLAVFDTQSTCADLRVCLEAVTGWLRREPDGPVIIMIELKDSFDASTANDLLAALDETLRASFTERELLTPAEVQKDSPTLSEALQERAWPTLGAMQARAMVFLLAGDFYAAYTANDTSLLDRAAFIAGSNNDRFAAVINVDDARGEAEQAAISEAHRQHKLIRVRADGEGDFGGEGRAEAALASGAHIVATDYPVAVSGVDYVLPWGAAPYRCNPATAADCAAQP